jgi:hypothetical protein
MGFRAFVGKIYPNLAARQPLTRGRTLRAHFLWRFHLPARMPPKNTSSKNTFSIHKEIFTASASADPWSFSPSQIPGLSSLPANTASRTYWPGETKDPGLLGWGEALERGSSFRVALLGQQRRPSPTLAWADAHHIALPGHSRGPA